ncbi:MAG: formylmethanofuran dehydrogenase subunit C [Candidatus Bathyarchaeota archaeon]|nr:formylmethanofuran dehydrogenase subunit C [Candidatus Bathyarchaeota archaeon]MDH5787499.1 formylmethanofuran dehydrogenase subunit C [Candidatus Bathyarchaeota archaeon]
MIHLYPKKEFDLPLIAECINPDVFQNETCEKIEQLKIWEGNSQKKLGELFKVEENQTASQPEKTAITIYGDMSKVRKIGACMQNGEIMIQGNVGMHLGEEMKGGKITVHGDAGGWAGSMMKGGVIEIHGNASDYLGAPYRGSSEGMRGGKIIIHGNVGSETGAHIQNGMIKIYGSAGQFAGFRMRKGIIYVQNDCGGRAGACMTEGTIIVGGLLESVLPTFSIEGVRKKAKIEEDEVVESPFYLFLGDLTESGKGRLYVAKEKNPHLRIYERLL